MHSRLAHRTAAVGEGGWKTRSHRVAVATAWGAQGKQCSRAEASMTPSHLAAVPEVAFAAPRGILRSPGVEAVAAATVLDPAHGPTHEAGET
mmetsp:Transcript_86565/g.242470  ORF Transcript_86565/g.242470 Transcript_86565/m.242470 type:complete len:92 (+) Transcript_86565:1049-1324(+)